MKRRDFLYLSGLGLGGSMLANTAMGSIAHIPYQDITVKRDLANVALNTAKAQGAEYADIRIGRYLNQNISTRERQVQNIGNAESYGAGIRVLVKGCWGFAATDVMTKEGIAKAATRAIQVAKVNGKVISEPVTLAPQKGYGEVSYKTPIEKNPFDVPLKEKIDLLLAVNEMAMKNGVTFVNSSISQINEQKYFASSDGSYIDQDVFRIWPNFSLTKTDKATNRFETRNALCAPVGMGWEYLTPDPKEEINGLFPLYKKRYNMIEDARIGALQLDEKLKAKPADPGKYDLILDPSHLFLTIHESVGHPTELDRVLGYEANYAGTSFLTLDKWESKKFNFGSKIVNFVADKTEPGSLGAVGYDDEGVKCGQWDIIKDGILVNYQAIRDQAHILGLKASQGCCYADNWSSIQFQRMPNVSLTPGTLPQSAADLIKNTEKGVYMFGRNSYSIDQQRYNFQFSAQLAYEIRNGKIVGMMKDAAYQANTQEFWNSCTSICDKSDYRTFGSFNDGKGQPSQSSAVSHGCSTTMFKGINVINTGRRI
ncbi:MAG: TldD/PmbA family protein [Chitinophagaceae bacterium]